MGVWLVYHLSGSRGSQGVVSASASRAYARRKNVMTGCRRTLEAPGNGSSHERRDAREGSMLLWFGKWVRGTVLGDQHG
jgi:hypothetical protein